MRVLVCNELYVYSDKFKWEPEWRQAKEGDLLRCLNLSGRTPPDEKGYSNFSSCSCLFTKKDSSIRQYRLELEIP